MLFRSHVLGTSTFAPRPPLLQIAGLRLLVNLFIRELRHQLPTAPCHGVCVCVGVESAAGVGLAELHSPVCTDAYSRTH